MKLELDGANVRFHEANSEWLRSFSCKDVRCLVVCRGPVRMEAFEVFEEMGLADYGMLLSEKDSIIYPRCLAPELRSIRNPQNVHRVTDYMGVGQDEKLVRIAEIIDIAKTHGYTHLFAGYGFMAEDADFIQAIEDAGLGFFGPSADVIRRAGAKDEAKKLARGLGNAVIPGIDNISALALLKTAGDRAALEACAAEHGLDFSYDGDLDAAENAEILLQAGYANSVELVTIEQLQAAAEEESRKIWAQYPDKRIRYKCIGGGGGKGQRVASRPEDVAAAVMDILAEQKVIEPGSNRNFLIELNLETTRHNEIQVVGNGEWAISLGGRDCSIQMHEQKQLEFSLTQELLDSAIAGYDGAVSENLKKDKQTLIEMEADSERFGSGVGLDSVSTFECIVEGFDHFFMEMNTRIQVEHGVSELCYAVRFTDPDDPNESFTIERLIELMVLIELHGKRLPRPERIQRHVSGAEIRVNATNRALRPHAGGLIRGWSSPLPYEIRDDQGIGARNPDTGAFVFYNLAGAYDSNIALILAPADDRRHNLERLSEILRVTELRGDDLETNIPVQYGLINWMLGKEPMLKPNTRFLTGWLAAVGAIRAVINDIDLDLAVREVMQRQPDAAARDVYISKETLLMRPIRRLLEDPHSLAGFFGLHDGEFWEIDGNEVGFKANPVRFLYELYHFLHWDWEQGKAASEMIWEDDHRVLDASLDYYDDVHNRTGASSWAELEKLFEQPSGEALVGDDHTRWEACVAAHRGFQIGLELLLLIPRIAIEAQFSEITINDRLEPQLPARFDSDEAPDLIKGLAPPPMASSDEIVAPSGGTFFAREAPHLPLLIEVGEHFEAGQPLFIIEVMKMFNKVLAPFSGTIVENRLTDGDGSVVQAGQVIFKIQPDEVMVEESEETIAARRQEMTLKLLS